MARLLAVRVVDGLNTDAGHERRFKAPSTESSCEADAATS